jgi:YspA, cpYpsA-related SLOG family
MRLAVSGSRHATIADYPKIAEHLRQLNPSFLILGDASGVDTMARRWAEENKIPYAVHYADWKRLGKAAGPARNQEMLDDLPEWFVAFWKEGSKGAANFVLQAERRGVSGDIVEL